MIDEKKLVEVEKGASDILVFDFYDHCGLKNKWDHRRKWMPLLIWRIYNRYMTRRKIAKTKKAWEK